MAKIAFPGEGNVHFLDRAEVAGPEEERELLLKLAEIFDLEQAGALFSGLRFLKWEDRPASRGNGDSVDDDLWLFSDK